MHCSTFSREIVPFLAKPHKQLRRQHFTALVFLKRPAHCSPIAILIIQCMESPSFKDLGICDELVEACVALGWANPTPVQAQAIPLALQDKDLIGLAQTGSGKTAAFIIPILQALLKASGPRFFFACVISPTRELAIQISEQFHALGSGIGLKCAVVVGGMNRVSEAIELGKRPHVLVGTPGRLLDHLSNTKGFNLRNLKFLVLDEADKLLDQDFGEVIDKILREVPKQRRTFLFSATMTKKVAKLQRLCLTNPAKVEVSFKYSVVDTLKQQIVVIPPQHKDCYLVFLLTEKIGKCVMVFTRTCDATTRVAMMLRILGFGAIPINGHMTQSKRLGALSKFKARDRNILVCTDVASRGLDIQGVDLVINYDLPTNSKDYIHRVGRTARAGKSGLAISFVTMYDAILCVLQRIEDSIGEKLTKIDLPEEEVFLLKERVTEAQNIAKHQMKDHDSSKKRKRRNENDDEIEM